MFTVEQLLAGIPMRSKHVSPHISQLTVKDPPCVTGSTLSIVSSKLMTRPSNTEGGAPFKLLVRNAHPRLTPMMAETHMSKMACVAQLKYLVCGIVRCVFVALAMLKSEDTCESTLR